MPTKIQWSILRHAIVIEWDDDEVGASLQLPALRSQRTSGLVQLVTMFALRVREPPNGTLEERAS